MARFLFMLRDTQPVAHGMHSVPFGASGSKVSNLAAETGYVRLYHESMLTIEGLLPPKPTTVVERDGYSVELLEAGGLALKAHELTMLPDYVEIGRDGNVVHRFKGYIGAIAPTFMERTHKGDLRRGNKAQWRVTKAAKIEDLRDHYDHYDDRIQAARAVCKAAGLVLPGEDGPA